VRQGGGLVVTMMQQQQRERDMIGLDLTARAAAALARAGRQHILNSLAPFHETTFLYYYLGSSNALRMSFTSTFATEKFWLGKGGGGEAKG
jgi:hypothetical protein